MTVTIGKPNPRQIEFMRAVARYIAYGGARGGGKSWAVRAKAILLATRYGKLPTTERGIKILILRRTFPELYENHIKQMRATIGSAALWRSQDKSFTFPNGSTIKFGYCKAESDVLQYQGQEYDVIFIDEATQFTEYQYSTLTACIRGTNPFPKRMYLTCNPGGVGHAWVKRLFIDRDYTSSERPEDYVFIKATVYDNSVLMDSDPDYVHMLENLPDGLREAWLLGSWDVFAGQYFTEWQPDVHVVHPFPVPADWRRYFSMDYGLDMLAGYVIAVDPQDRAYVIKEIYQSGLIIYEAAEAVRQLCEGEDIFQYFAPPDLWNRNRDTGRSVAEIFGEYDIYLTQTDNERVNGWMDMHERMRVTVDEQGQRSAGLRIFSDCKNLIRCIPLLQFDEKKPNDVSGDPHELTHAPDAVRYFCAGRPYAAPPEPPKKQQLPFALRDDEPSGNGVMMW